MHACNACLSCCIWADFAINFQSVHYRTWKSLCEPSAGRLTSSKFGHQPHHPCHWCLNSPECWLQLAQEWTAWNNIRVSEWLFPKVLYHMMSNDYKWMSVELQVNLLTASVSAVSERQGCCSCLVHNLIMSHQTISVTRFELATAVTICLSAWSN